MLGTLDFRTFGEDAAYFLALSLEFLDKLEDECARRFGPPSEPPFDPIYVAAYKFTSDGPEELDSEEERDALASFVEYAIMLADRTRTEGLPDQLNSAEEALPELLALLMDIRALPVRCSWPPPPPSQN